MSTYSSLLKSIGSLTVCLYCSCDTLGSSDFGRSWSASRRCWCGGLVCGFISRLGILTWFSAGGGASSDLDDGLGDSLLRLLRRVVNDLSQIEAARDLYSLSVNHLLMSLEGNLEGVVELHALSAKLLKRAEHLAFEGLWFISLAGWCAEANGDTIGGLTSFSIDLTITFTVDLSKVEVGDVAHCL